MASEMRFLFLVYIVVMALFALTTVAVDQAQLAHLEAEAKAKQERLAADAAAKEAKQKADLKEKQEAEEKRQQEAREREERERQEAHARLEEEQFRLLEQQETERRRQTEDQCDRLAGNGFDNQRNQSFVGVSYDILRLNSASAVSNCRDAVAQSPKNLRLRYQLARALQAQKNPEAQILLEELTRNNYPIAYDNLGWWYYNAGNPRVAVSYFRAGAQLGDPESMVSLAGHLLEGRHVPRDEDEAMLLLAEAESYGHPAAIRAMDEFRVQRQMNALGVEIFSRVLSELARRAN